jgi:hypothetical protein
MLSAGIAIALRVPGYPTTSRAGLAAPSPRHPARMRSTLTWCGDAGDRPMRMPLTPLTVDHGRPVPAPRSLTRRGG